MPEQSKINLRVNGEEVTVTAFPFENLLGVLRDRLQLGGTKEGCGEGECGACSVFLNSRLVNSCLVPIAQCQGADIKTIESKELAPLLENVQQAFLKNGGAQCGICTPGMILAAVNLLQNNPDPDRDQIRTALAGNLCRCTGYIKIIDSVLDAAKQVGSTNAY